MEIIPSSQRVMLVDYLKLLKFGLAEWLIVEVKLIAPNLKDLTAMAAADLLNGVFSSYQGRILVCNPTEILMLIEWGKDNNPHELAKQLSARLPPDICETTVIPPTQKGLKKIELLLAPITSEHGNFYQARIKRQSAVFLIADDDMYMRLLAKKGLQDLGTVIDVGEGGEVVETYRTYNPDMVLLDIHMPGMTGQEVLKQLKEVDPQVYVIMLSADSSIENVQWAQQHGAKGFLTKPFNKAKLLNYVEICPTYKRKI